jgi:hypothetical protein
LSAAFKKSLTVEWTPEARISPKVIPLRASGEVQGASAGLASRERKNGA